VEGATIARVVHQALDAGLPVVGTLATGGLRPDDGVGSLGGLGEVAFAMTRASGSIPIVLIASGPVTGAPALLLGLADVVIATDDARCWVTGPGATARWTGREVRAGDLGGSGSLGRISGVAHLIATNDDDAMHLAGIVLAHLPDNVLGVPPRMLTSDPRDRKCDRAEQILPVSPFASYDVREIIRDIVDDGDFIELKRDWATNLVTALATVDGYVVGIVANQPNQLAGTLNIAASQKGARFVRWCDAFNIPLLTLVDTPGFQPGKDIEWQGMIRKGAQLVQAYAGATVPRVCVILRKAYGGAYIAMDSKTMGNDVCLAWPTAEIAVMGAAGAVEILHRRELAEIADGTDRATRRAALEHDYAERMLSPLPAAERGFVDAVIAPADTRRSVADALEALATKRETLPHRRHDNLPL
jgi:acetyl-CoA carboxylase carboxyltransferase component